MPRDSSITARDLIGKLDLLRVECAKCDRRGQYWVDHLYVRLGPDARLTTWLHRITADCPWKRWGGFAECGVTCPDLLKWPSRRRQPQ
jgi:hypothetical protein